MLDERQRANTDHDFNEKVNLRGNGDEADQKGVESSLFYLAMFVASDLFVSGAGVSGSGGGCASNRGAASRSEWCCNDRADQGGIFSGTFGVESAFHPASGGFFQYHGAAGAGFNHAGHASAYVCAEG